MSSTKSAALLSLATNALLVGLKLAVGLYIGSISILSDALDSGMDLVGAVIAVFAVRLAAQPADRSHPYGHGKAESLSAMFEGSLILLAALLIFREAIHRLQTGERPETVGLGIMVMALSAALNIAASLYLRRAARKTGSPALEAAASHRGSDIMTSMAILGGLLIFQFSPWKSIDPIMAILVATFVAWTALRLLGRSARDLMDASIPREEEAALHDILHGFQDEYVEYHNLRTRRSGSFREIDFHLVMPSTVTVGVAHDLTDRIEAAIEKRLPRSMTTIHVEPSDAPAPGMDGEQGDSGATCQPVPRIQPTAQGQMAPAPEREG